MIAPHHTTPSHEKAQKPHYPPFPPTAQSFPVFICMFPLLSKYRAMDIEISRCPRSLQYEKYQLRRSQPLELPPLPRLIPLAPPQRLTQKR